MFEKVAAKRGKKCTVPKRFSIYPFCQEFKEIESQDYLGPLETGLTGFVFVFVKYFIAVQNLINPRLLLYCFGLVIKNPNRVFDEIKSDNKSLDTVPLTP